MPINYHVPFYGNTKDDTHCFQAALRMVLGYFLPERNFSWAELDKITAKQPDMWTWPMAGLCWLADSGFDVIDIEDFDYARFAAEKENYLIEKFGREMADEQIKYSVVEEETERARKFTEVVSVDERIPTIEMLKKLLDDGYLVIVNLNIRSLQDRSGYMGHFVVVKGYDIQHNLILQDPGNPPRENLSVSVEQFKKGWDYPDKGARNLVGVKPV